MSSYLHPERLTDDHPGADRSVNSEKQCPIQPHSQEVLERYKLSGDPVMALDVGVTEGLRGLMG